MVALSRFLHEGRGKKIVRARIFAFFFSLVFWMLLMFLPEMFFPSYFVLGLTTNLGPSLGFHTSGGVTRFNGSLCVEGELLVSFRNEASLALIRKLKESMNVVSSVQPSFADFEKIRVPSERMWDILCALRKSPLVRYAEPNYVRRISSWIPNDPLFDKQWNFKDFSGNGGIGMPEAWTKVTTGGKGVSVGVIDTGVAYRTAGIYRKAPDLSGTKFAEGYDFANEDPYPDDDNGHGTHVCGTIAQTTNNAYGVAGAAFGVTIIPVKSFDDTGFGIDEDIARGIRFAVDKGAKVINLSFGGEGSSAVLESAIDYAISKGAVVCASSGNDNEGRVDYPAAYKNCIAVGATNRAKRRASYSNYGPELDVVAPGGEAVPDGGIIQNTYVTQGDPTSGFGFLGMAGTSMACAHVNAVVALIKSINPSWTPDKIRSALTSTCHDLGSPGWDQQYGYGLIDAASALSVVEPPNTSALSVNSVSPDTVKSGERERRVTIRGSGFFSPMSVRLERFGEETIQGRKIKVTGPNEMECTFDFSKAQPGLYNLIVSRSSGTSTSLKGGILVILPESRQWFFAEGCTAHGFEEYILFANPSEEQAFASVTFMTKEGAKDPYPIIIPPQSRKTLRVNDLVFESDVSVKIEADREIFCERSMYWGGMLEGTSSPGIQAPSFSWLFAEGCTAWGFETFILIQNPDDAAAKIEVTYMTPSGSVQKPAFSLSPNSRHTINVSSELPSSEFSVSIRADRRVVAERSMYWDSRRGGHSSYGTTGLSSRWFLAEGTTGWGFSEYVLVANPSDSTAVVEFRQFGSAESYAFKRLSVPPGSRFTVFLNENLPERDVALQVSCESGTVVERAMYWNNGSGKAGHCTLASPRASKKWYLAEGSTSWGFETWVLVLNPGQKSMTLRLRYLPEKGLPFEKDIVVSPSRRLTVDVALDMPNRDLSFELSSDMPFVVERAMYWNGRSGGHVSFGTLR